MKRFCCLVLLVIGTSFCQNIPAGIEDSIWVAIDDFEYVNRAGETDLHMHTLLYRKSSDSTGYDESWCKDTLQGEITIMIVLSMDSSFTEIREVLKRRFHRGRRNEYTLTDLPIGRQFWISIDVEGNHSRFVMDGFIPGSSRRPEETFLHRYPMVIMIFVAFFAFIAGYLISRFSRSKFHTGEN